MATKEEKKDRNTRIERTKDQTNLIYDILSSSTSPVIINLRKLYYYGINDKMIEILYGNFTSSMETRDSAMDTLRKVYIELVRTINRMPNGIILNEKTADMNIEKSRKQAVEVGIEDNYLQNMQKIGREVLKQLVKDKKLPENFLSKKESLGIIDYTAGVKLFGASRKSKDDEMWDKYREIMLAEKRKEIEKIGDISKLSLEDRVNFVMPILETLMYGNLESRREAYEQLKNIFSDIIAELKDENKVLAKILEIKTGEKIDYKTTDELYNIFEKVSEEEHNKIRENMDIKNKVFEIESKILLSDKSSKRYLDLIEEREEIYKNNPKLKEFSETLKDDYGELNEIGKEYINNFIEKQKDYILAIEAKISIEDTLNPEYKYLIEERNKFFKNNPEYINYLKEIKDDSGNLTKYGKNKLNNYINELRDKEINVKIAEFYRKCGENCESKSLLEKEELNNYVAYFLVGGSTNYNEETIKKSQEILKKIYPEFANDESNEILEDIVNKVLEINSDNEYDSAICADKLFSMRNNLDKVLLGEIVKEEKISDYEMYSYYEKISVDLEVDQKYLNLVESNIKNKNNVLEINITESEMQNRFNKNSKMKFSDTDEKTFFELYKKSSIGSWISTKEEVDFHKYMGLLILKDKLSQNKLEDGEVKNKIAETLLRSMRINNPELVKKISEYTPEKLQELKEQEKVFEKNKLNAKVLDFYQKNVFNSNVDYSSLDKEQKYEYLRMIIISRELSKTSDMQEERNMFLKLSNKALEMMNKEKIFIEFDEEGKEIINEDALLSEYGNYTTVNRINGKTLDEVGKNVYNAYQKVYFIGKMKEYSKLKEKDFVKLESNTDEEKLNEIIKIREQKNKERFNEIINQQKSIETNKSEEKKLDKQEDLIVKEKNEEDKKTINERENKSLVVQDTSIFGKIRAGFNKLKEKISKYFINENMHEKKENSFYKNNSNELNEKNNKKEYTNSNYDRTESWVVDGVSGKIDPNKINRDKSVKEIAENEREEEK